MIAEQDPFITPYLDLDPVQSLPPEDRALLTILFTGSGSLADLAHQCGLDLLTLAERILAPEIQAALESIKRAATELSHVRALIGRPIAIATLEAVSTEINPNPIERRRAASALLRAAPIASAPHAPHSASAIPSANRAATGLPPATPDLAHDRTVYEPCAAHPPEPLHEPFAPEFQAPSLAPIAPAHESEITGSRPTFQTSPDRPKPASKSRDRPPLPLHTRIPLAGKPPLIVAA